MMRFAAASRFSAGDYATAASAGANALASTFDAARKSAPDWTGLARTSMNARSTERQAAMKAEADVATAGMKAFGNVKDMQIKGAYALEARKTEIDSRKRMAGRLGALGGFKMPKKPRKKATLTQDQINAQVGVMEQSLNEMQNRPGFEAKPFDPNNMYDGGIGDTSSTPQQTPTNPSSPPADGQVQKTVASAGANTGALNFQSVSQMAANAGAKFPNLVAAQWQLESGGGSSELAVKHNNLFGQKGAGVSYNTKEDYGNGMQTVNANFMTFASPQESVNYLVDRWYKDFGQYKGVNNAGSFNEAANMLKQQGYATDPKYVEKLIRIGNQYS